MVPKIAKLCYPIVVDGPSLPHTHLAMAELIIVVVGILILSGFFSGAEAALVSLTEPEVHSLHERKVLGSSFLERVHRQLNRSVITIVVWNNIINIVGSIMVGQIVIKLYGDAILAVITTGLTFGIIIFSEIIPKAIGIHYAERIGIICAPLILIMTTVMLPIIIALEKLTNLFKHGERKVGTEAQIRSLVTIGRRQGHIESDEGQLIHRAFILNDKKAYDIMTPLKDIIALQSDITVNDAWEKIKEDVHTRYPLFGSSIHELEGIVLRQDVLEALYEEQDDEAITTLTREGLVVPETMPSDELIGVFRDKSIHLAVVQDEDGHTVGLVTLEDVLEELVGEIEDEIDVED